MSINLLEQGSRIEAAGRLDDVGQGRPPGTMAQRAEGLQDADGLLSWFGGGHDRHAMRPDRAERAEIEVWL